MRNSLLIIVALFTLFSCGEESKKVDSTYGFEIVGQLDNATEGMIYLDRFGKSSSVKVDSAEVSKDGKFVLTGTTKTPDIFILHTDKSNFSYLIVDKKETVKLSGDMTNLKTGLSVTNSVGTAQLFELNTHIGALQSQLDSIQGLYDQIEDKENNKGAIGDLGRQSQGLIDAHTDYLRNFIKANSGSLSSIAALYQQVGRQRLISPDLDLPYFVMVDSTLMSKYPNNYHVKEFHRNYIAMTTEQREERVRAAVIGVGSIAPEITYPDPSGQMRSLSDLKGNYVLLDFWAAWCRPCRMESPTLVANYAKYNKKGFEIFQVSLDKEKNAWIGAIEADKLTWPYHVSDLKHWKSAPAKLYNVQSIPANYLLDPEGKVIASNLRGAALGQKLAEIFGE